MDEKNENFGHRDDEKMLILRIRCKKIIEDFINQQKKNLIKIDF